MTSGGDELSPTLSESVQTPVSNDNSIGVIGANQGGRTPVSAPVSDIQEDRWWEDPDRLAAFLAEYQRQIPQAFADQMESRNTSAKVREHKARSLQDAVESVAQTMLFNEISVDDFDGVAHDSLNSTRSWLREQVRQYQDWQRGLERGENSVHSLEYMKSWARATPPEIILSKMIGTPVTELEFSPELSARISLARNQMIRDASLAEGQLWEISPAAVRAASALGYAVVARGLDFNEIIPEWRQLNALVESEIDSYWLELETIAAEFLP